MKQFGLIVMLVVFFGAVSSHSTDTKKNGLLASVKNVLSNKDYDIAIEVTENSKSVFYICNNEDFQEILFDAEGSGDEVIDPEATEGDTDMGEIKVNLDLDKVVNGGQHSPWTRQDKLAWDKEDYVDTKFSGIKFIHAVDYRVYIIILVDKSGK